MPISLANHSARSIASDRHAVATWATLADFVKRQDEAEAAAARLRAFVLAQHDVDTNAGRLLEIYESARATRAAVPGR